ncbi:hypothetical protein EDC04DRAFT_2607535 [Pisolithus marmoratus]|nr:hypothetical protein EDC04DRAFT_2607535 [Pisolithus marmoratus]
MYRAMYGTHKHFFHMNDVICSSPLWPQARNAIAMVGRVCRASDVNKSGDSYGRAVRAAKLRWLRMLINILPVGIHRRLFYVAGSLNPHRQTLFEHQKTITMKKILFLASKIISFDVILLSSRSVLSPRYRDGLLQHRSTVNRLTGRVHYSVHVFAVDPLYKLSYLLLYLTSTPPFHILSQTYNALSFHTPTMGPIQSLALPSMERQDAERDNERGVTDWFNIVGRSSCQLDLSMSKGA